MGKSSELFDFEEVKGARAYYEKSKKGEISSINFKKSNAIQTLHNDRKLPPSYLIGGDCEANRNSQQALMLKDKIIKDSVKKYTERTGQKFQAKSYEWSAVCNIKPETTMQDLEKLAKHFKDKYGFQCYQIAIHRDEGHINEQGEKVINHHAHLEFITLDKETGKNLYNRQNISPKILREIQTEVADILQMQRGTDKRLSGVKRIEPRTYARLKEQEKLERTEQNEILQVKEALAIVENTRKESKNKGYSQEYFKELSSVKKELKSQVKAITKEVLKTKLQEIQKKHQKTIQETLQQTDMNQFIEKKLLTQEVNKEKLADFIKHTAENQFKAISSDFNQEIEQTYRPILENAEYQTKIALELQKGLKGIKEYEKNNIRKREAEIKAKTQELNAQEKEINKNSNLQQVIADRDTYKSLWEKNQKNEVYKKAIFEIRNKIFDYDNKGGYKAKYEGKELAESIMSDISYLSAENAKTIKELEKIKQEKTNLSALSDKQTTTINNLTKENKALKEKTQELEIKNTDLKEKESIFKRDLESFTKFAKLVFESAPELFLKISNILEPTSPILQLIKKDLLQAKAKTKHKQSRQRYVILIATQKGRKLNIPFAFKCVLRANK